LEDRGINVVLRAHHCDRLASAFSRCPRSGGLRLYQNYRSYLVISYHINNSLMSRGDAVACTRHTSNPVGRSEMAQRDKIKGSGLIQMRPGRSSTLGKGLERCGGVNRVLRRDGFIRVSPSTDLYLCLYSSSWECVSLSPQVEQVRSFNVPRHLVDEVDN